MSYLTLSEDERRVLDIILKHSHEDKIMDPEIRRQVTVHDPDHQKKGAGLRRVINSLRQKGYAICSDTRGYWYARSKQELLANAEALRGRAVKIIEAARGMEHAADRYDELQQTLFHDRPKPEDIIEI